jgi:hypothetical protein
MSKITQIVFYASFFIYAVFHVGFALLVAGIAALILAIIMIAGN